MSEDLYPVADAKFREDVGRDDNEYSAYMAVFRSGVAHARRTPPPALARLLKWLDENPESYGIRACSYGILKCLDELRAEWAEKKGGTE